MKKALSILLSVLTILSVCAVPVFASDVSLTFSETDVIFKKSDIVKQKKENGYYFYYLGYYFDLNKIPENRFYEFWEDYCYSYDVDEDDDPYEDEDFIGWYIYDCLYYDIDYSSSDSNVVDAGFDAGVFYLQPLCAGTATVTLELYGYKASCKVTIIEDADSISIDKKTKTAYVGKAFKLNATLSPVSANEQITWSSSNTNIATVTSKGVVHPVAPGTVNITATTTFGKKASCNVTVYQSVSSIKLDKTKFTVNKAGCYLQLTATVSPSNAYNKTVTWTSSNKKVATVDSNGKVTIIGKGTAVITAKAKSGVTATCKIVCKTSKHDHIYKSTKVASTCTKKGYTYSKCIICGDVTKSNYKKALGHTWVKKSGVNGRVCSECGAKYCAENGHTWKKATCTAPKTCTECKKTSGKALGHNWTSKITKAATCTAKGKKTVTCTVCKKKVEKTISALGHNCKNGYCTRCDKSVKSLLKYYIKKYGYYDDGLYKIHMNYEDGAYTTFSYNEDKNIINLVDIVELDSGIIYGVILELPSDCGTYKSKTCFYDEYTSYFYGERNINAATFKSSTTYSSFSYYESDEYGVRDDMIELLPTAVCFILDCFEELSLKYNWGLDAKDLGFTKY